MTAVSRPRQCRSRAKIVHAHIPKTAGTAFNLIMLHGNFRNEQILKCYTRKTMMRSLSDSEDEARYAAAPAVAGHIPFGFFDDLPGEAVYVSIFREPASRFLSFINFLMQSPHHGLWQTMSATQRERSQVDPNAFIAAIYGRPLLRARCSNVQVRFAAGIEWAGKQSGLIPPDALDAARVALGRPNYLFGVQERFAEFCGFAADALGIEDSYAGHEARKGAADLPVDEATREQWKIFRKVVTLRSLDDISVAMIARMNELDQRLFDEVAARSENLKAA